MASRTSIDKSADKITKMVANSSKVIEGLIIAHLASKKDIRYAVLGTAILRELNRLEKKIYPLIKGDIKEHYITSALEGTNILKRYGFVASGALDVNDRFAIKALQSDTLNKFGEALKGAFNSARDVMTEGRKKKIEMIFVEGLEQRKTPKQLREEIIALLEEDFFAIRDKSGKRWKLDVYSNMLTRTRMREATNMGMSNRLKREGKDLVQVSDHPSECELCRPWEAKILSITGRTAGYPTVTDAEMAGLFHPNCYDKHTQVYTDLGWKYFKDLKGNEKIFSLNPKTLEPVWLPFVNLISYKYEGEMYHYKGKSFDLKVTPNHSLFIGYSGKENGKKKEKYRLCEASKTPKNFRQLRCVSWGGEELDYTDEFIRLVGYFLAEGCVDKSGYSKKVVISQEKEQEMIDDLLKMGFYQNDSRLLKTDKKLFNYFKDFGKASEKQIPTEFMTASKRQIRILLDAFRLGDGSTIKGGKYNALERVYYTSSERLAEQLGELIVKVGNYPSFRFENRKGRIVKHKNGEYKTKTDMWVVRENTSKHSYFNSSPSIRHRGIQLEKIYYNDFVYDVELPKYHVLFVRRNGKTAWSGNCKHRLLPAPIEYYRSVD
jgi:hypothetical protein